MRQRFALGLGMLFAFLLSCRLFFPDEQEPASPSTDIVATQVAMAITQTAMAIPPATPSALPLTATPTAPLEFASFRIAYLQRGDLWIWSLEEGARRLTSSGDVRQGVWLSPDKAWVAYLRWISATQPELWAIPASGGEPRRLVSAAELQALDPEAVGVMPNPVVWVPGHPGWLAYNTSKVVVVGEAMEPPIPHYYHNLDLVHVETLERRTLRAPGTGGLPFYAPSGTRVALSTYTQLALMNADGTDYRVVFTYPETPSIGYAYHARPVWTRDETAMLVIGPPPGGYPPASDENVDVLRIPVTGGDPVVLSRLPADAESSAQFDPTRTFVAYLRYESEDRTMNLVLQRVDDASRRAVASVPPSQLLLFHGWAPDASVQRFAYTLDNVLYFGQPDMPGMEVYRASAGMEIRQVKWLSATALLVVEGYNGSRSLVYVEIGAPGRVERVVDGVEAFDGRQ